MGALREATFYIARADDYRQARADAGAAMDRLLNALRTDDIGWSVATCGGS